jgi:hypothetical protein
MKQKCRVTKSGQLKEKPSKTLSQAIETGKTGISGSITVFLL